MISSIETSAQLLNTVENPPSPNETVKRNGSSRIVEICKAWAKTFLIVIILIVILINNFLEKLEIEDVKQLFIQTFNRTNI